jgi:hypothetical protein
MTPQFQDPASDDLTALRRALVRMAEQFGEMAGSKDLGMVALAGDTSFVPHGLGRKPKRWGYSNPTEFATVRQDKEADSTFLYLSASAPVTVAIQVW